MSIIYWIIVGALAGWIASMIMGMDERMGWLANVGVGILGAILGGWLLGALFGYDPDNIIANILTALLGAVILLWGYRMIRGRGRGAE